MIASPLLCLVVAITDGDTIKTRCTSAGSHEQITVRVSAIDAPESRQPFGQRSKQRLSDMCFHAIASITPRATDRYGRMVGDVECQGRDVATEQVRSGMAWYYVKYGKGYEHLGTLQAEARTVGRGLWAEEAVAPWEWRSSRATPARK